MNFQKILAMLGGLAAKISDPNVKKLIEDDGVKSFLFGKYTDGTARNFADAMAGEYLSPKQKKKYSKKKKKKDITKFRFK